MLVASVGLVSCGGSKQVAESPQSTPIAQPAPVSSSTSQDLADIQNQIAIAKARAELAKIQQENAIAAAHADAELAQINAQIQETLRTGVPCWHKDDDDYFYASTQQDFDADNVAETALLRAADFQMRQKLQKKYTAILRDYADQMRTEEGRYYDEHIESAGEGIVDAFMNPTEETCREQLPLDPQGKRIRFYMGVRSSKKAFVDNALKTIPALKEKGVRVKEEAFRNSVNKVVADNSEE